MKRTLLVAIFALIPNLAFAEETVLYSYTKTLQKPADWAVMPVLVDVSSSRPEGLFDALKRRKLPTYGNTSFETGSGKSSGLVKIDETKCAYASIISAEIGLTFDAHGYGVPEFSCDGRKIVPAGASLTHFAAIVPLWQALTAQSIEQPALVQVGNEFLSVDDFQTKLQKQDKNLIKIIESEFDTPALFAKTGVMKGYISRKFPNAEKRVAKELGSLNSNNVSAAMAALANTKDSAILNQMKSILQKKGDFQEGYALSMVESDEPMLRDEALLILLKSSVDANFSKAASIVAKDPSLTILIDHLKEILDVATPSHAKQLATMLINGHRDEALEQWLDDAQNSDAVQGIAQVALSSSKAVSLRHVSMSWLMLSSSADTAFDALDDLLWEKQTDFDPSIWKRGLKAKYAGIMLACRDELRGVLDKTPSSDLGIALFEKAQNNADDAVASLMEQAYHSNSAVRSDVAYATQWLDGSADALRTVMLKDSDEMVVMILLSQTAKRPAAEISLAMVKEFIARTERSFDLKIAALHALPFMMNEKTAQTISTFAANEMFDDPEAVKIAAIRSLGQIAVLSTDPMIQDNAVTSLALTAQDKSPSIVHHTLMALGKTKVPAAREIIERAKSTHPESATRALRYFK